MANDITGNVFDPQTVSVKSYDAIVARQSNHDGEIRSGIKTLDDVMLPMRPGQLAIVLGYTSNYKSGFMNYIARYNALRLMNDDFAAGYSRAVITFTWEQSVEEQGIVDIAQLTGIDAALMMRGELPDTAWVALRRGATDRGAIPWWVVGHSSEGGKRRPRLTMTDAAQALAYIADVQGIAPALIVLDYAQRIRQENANSRRDGLMDIVDRAKDMALAFRCPVLLGCQAGRSVKEHGSWMLPRLDDAQEASIEQIGDLIFGLWMPKNDYHGQTIQGPDGSQIVVTDNLLIVAILKQKFGVAPVVRYLHVKPEVNEITPLEVVRL